MTQVIDGRVVEMQFDNSNFEKNVAQSMSTLEKLKNALNFDSAKSLEGIGNAANKVNMSGIGTAVEEVQARFSALQVVGMTALSEITKSAMNLGSTLIHKVVDPIKTGGMNRALNIEQAKFQLKGLGVAWEDVVDDINYGVKSTAYGLGDAARAAAQFAASGVQLGDDMKAALRGISGVAAMTGASYEEISNIFTTVSGKGKAMANEFNRIGLKGLNAKATVANYMNEVSAGTKDVSDSIRAMVADITGGLKVTEADIADFASKGKINFELFSKALDDAFGDHAKAANDTYTGSLMNVRAALSRIGEGFATPYMENVRLIAVETIKALDAINAAMKPIHNDVAGIMEMVQKTITSFLSDKRVPSGFASIINGVRNAYYALLLVLEPIKQAMRDIFPKQDVAERFNNLARSFEKFTNSLVISKEATDNLKRTFRGIFAIVDILRMAFVAAFNAIKPFGMTIKETSGSFLEFTANIGDAIVKLRDTIKQNNTFTKAFNKTAFVIRVAIQLIKNSIRDFKNGVLDFKKIHIDTKDFSGITGFFDRLKERFKEIGGVGDVLKKIFGEIGKAFEGFKPVAEGIGELVSSLVGGVLKGFSNAFGGEKLDAYSAFINIFSSTAVGSMIINMSTAFSKLYRSLQQMGGVSPLLNTIKTGLINTFAQLQAEIKADVILRISKALALFVGSLLVLSMINTDKLEGGLVAIGAILVMMRAMYASMDTLNTQLANLSFIEGMKKNIQNFTSELSNLMKANTMSVLANMLIKAAAAVLILAVAIRAIGTLRPDQIIYGLGAVILLLSALYEMAKKFNNKDVFQQKSIMQGAGQLILLATAVRILASSIKAIGKMDFQDVIEGTAAIFAVMLAMTEMLQKTGGKSINAGTGFAFIELAASILLIGKAIAQLGELGEDQLLQGGLAVGTIGAAIAVFLKVVSEMSGLADMASVGVAVVALAASMYIVAQAIEALASLSVEQLSQGMITLGVALVAMGVGLKVLSDASNAGDLIATAASLAILGVAMNLIAAAISNLAGQDPFAVITAMIALAGAIVAFAVAAMLCQPIIPMLVSFGASLALFGVSVLALGAGLTLLAVAINMFIAIGPEFVTVMFELGVCLAAFAVAALVLQPALVPMLMLAGVLAVIGVAAVVVGVGLMAVGMGLSTIAVVGEAGAVAIEAVAASFLVLSVGIIALAESIVALIASTLGLAASLAVLSLMILSNALTFTILAGVSAVASVLLIAYSAAAGLAAVATLALAGSLSLLFGVLDTVLPGISDFVNSIQEGFISMCEDIYNSIEDLKANISNKVNEFIQLGKDLIGGFIAGLKDAPLIGDVIQAGENIANAALNAIADTQDSHSPSKEGEKEGKSVPDGYAIGEMEGIPEVEDVSSLVGEAGLSGLLDGEDQANIIGSDTTDQYSLGILEGIPGVSDAANQVRDAMVNPLADGANEASSYMSVIDIYNNRYSTNVKTTRAKEQADRNSAKALGAKAAAEEGVILKTKEETEATKDATEGQKDYASALGGTSKAAKESKSSLSDLASTIDNQIDIFKKFELKTDITAAQMLENMKSNIDGVASWSKRLNDLVDKGISKELYNKLAEMGPNGYETLNAFVQMTDEQLQQANELFAQSLTLGEGQAKIVTDGADRIGKGIGEGVIGGLAAEQSAMDAAAKDSGKEVVDSMAEGAGVHSPSVYTFQTGINILLGLNKGICDQSTIALLRANCEGVCKKILDIFNKTLESSQFTDIGKNIAQGLADGMDANTDIVTSAASKLSKAAEVSSKKTSKVESPSKVFMAIGRYISMGLAIGILDAASNVEKASATVADDAINAMSDVATIQDIINSELDFNPIITPLLDLSYLREQMGEVNGLFSDKRLSASAEFGQNGGKMSGQQINFTQNNYSPKALSRIDIYRQTKNQVSMMKGVMAHA